MQEIVQHSFKEQEEHAMFKSVPDKVDMWVKTVGNPIENHQKMMELYGVFCNVCDKLQVKAWILYGSIIGYIRHKGIIPWEWNMDVGVSTEDYQKLLKQQSEYSDDNWEFTFYADPPAPYYKGYPGETFCFRHKKIKIQVDICEYKEVGDQLVPQVPVEYDSNEYEAYPKNEIYPLQRINLCGFGSWLPKNPYSVLKWYKQDLSWYDPVPFILTKLYNPIYTELLCKPATKNIPEVASFTEGIEKYGKFGLSFVVRKMQGIELNLDMFLKYKLFGWDKQGQPMENLDSKEIISQWQQDKLKINFVDSHAPNLTSFKNTDMGKYIKDEDLMIILSNNHTYTPFHIDAVDTYYDEKYKDNFYKGWTRGGGGWMYLHQGQKLWQILNPKFVGNLYNKEKNRLNDYPVHELLYMNNHAMWGELEVSELNAGDFLYFGPGLIHRVWTYERSFGIGGYFDFPGNEPNKEAAMKYMKDAGVDVEKFPGVWF